MKIYGTKRTLSDCATTRWLRRILKEDSALRILLSGLLLLVALVELTACDGGEDIVLVGPGESCTRMADCEPGLQCSDQICQKLDE